VSRSEGKGKKSEAEEFWLGGKFMKQKNPLQYFAYLLGTDNPLYQQLEASVSSPETTRSEAEQRLLAADTPPEGRESIYSYFTDPQISITRGYKGGGNVQNDLEDGKMTSPLMAAHGGVPHKGSHYVQGAGGGQDDLIPARLADGEYVFDAEIVAALGDGSNKEGARKLDAMREAIRKHKRSAPLNDIPPKAKSPLAYLKGVK
jgi:hypothetical protein